MSLCADGSGTTCQADATDAWHSCQSRRTRKRGSAGGDGRIRLRPCSSGSGPARLLGKLRAMIAVGARPLASHNGVTGPDPVDEE
jgi:hypothetical protein